MQSKNQVVILGIKNRNRPLSQTVQLTKLVKRDCHPTLLLPPGLQTLFFTFTMLWTCSVQNGVDLGEVSIFHKVEKTSGQTDKNSNTFAPYRGRLVF